MDFSGLISFNIEIYGIKLTFDHIDTSQAIVCSSLISATHSVFCIVYMTFFQDVFVTILDYRKIVFLIILIKSDVELFTECGYR